MHPQDTTSPETKRCSKCGETKALTAFCRTTKANPRPRSICKACDAAYLRVWRTANRDRDRARTRAYRAANRDRIREQQRKWFRAERARNPEKARARWRQWWAANREHGRAWARGYHAIHRDRILARRRAWQTSHRRQWLAQMTLYQLRRKRRLSTNGPHETIIAYQIAERDNWRCHICGRPIKPKDLTLDHLIPVSRGGTHRTGNVAAAHRRCNSRRFTGRIPAQLRLL